MPTVDELLDGAIGFAAPLMTHFRGTRVRQGLLLRGPVGWGEFAPFPEYGADESARWLAAAIEAAWIGWPSAVRDSILVNAVVPLEELEVETVQWCREMLEHSPLALRMLKASLNAADDGLAGVQQLAGDATLLFYMTEEAQEGRDAYVAKRKPDFGKFPKRP